MNASFSSEEIIEHINDDEDLTSKGMKSLGEIKELSEGQE